MREDTEREVEKALMTFKMTAIAMHPKHAKRIMAIGQKSNENEYTAPMSDEEMERYVPVQHQPDVRKQVISDLRSMGLAVIDE